MHRKGYITRFLFCAVSLMFYGFGNFLGVKAGSAGTNAWNTLAIGISDMTGISFGTAVFCVSMAIIVIDLLGKGKLGFGTILNAVLIASFSDVFLELLHFFPVAPNAFVGAIYTLVGQTVISFSTIFYMLPALGCGPRDTLMVIVGKKFPKAPIGVVKFAIEVAVLLVGMVLGAPFGIGTVLVMALQASIFQLACKVTHYEPRAVAHEDVIDTCRNILKK